MIASEYVTPSPASQQAEVSVENLAPHAGIIGLGMALPERVLTNTELAQQIDTSDEWIRTRTGIAERRVSDAHTATSDLALEAARNALADAGISPQELDLILCATTSGDYIWPSTACVVQARLGAMQAGAFDLAAACSGFTYGMATAAGFIQSRAMRRILVIGADTLTKQLNWEDRGTCILFGDGAGAAVLAPCGPDEGVLASVLGADGTGLEAVWIPGGGTRTPLTADSIARKEHCIAMQGKEVYRFAVERVPAVVEEALRRACLRTSDIDLLVLHQANIRIIQAAAQRLGIPEEKCFVNVDRYGNTSAASIPIALTEAWQQGRLQRGHLVVTVGFGAGLTWGANVIRWNRAGTTA